jgi:hypothetical protein
MSKKGPFDTDEPSEGTPPATESAKNVHPLIGCMKGTVTIPEGVDLTEPACPEWADLIDQMMPLPNEGNDIGS